MSFFFEFRQSMPFIPPPILVYRIIPAPQVADLNAFFFFSTYLVVKPRLVDKKNT